MSRIQDPIKVRSLLDTMEKREGYDSFFKGVTLDECPYSVSRESMSWKTGWQLAEVKVKAGKL